ncbi:predicted protein [Cyanophage PSS2]|uniref:RNA polymerase sigma factor n=1 Tax=Cyanophage PSS2 TaxID=658401 RepID=UPI0001B03FD9|nr:RNA polymerase sigma factor [Cyanophage PSS2]ACT65565.1 type III RNAP sigma factor [Cyanophage PSS2]ACY75710.1 predicted protein [Cyanophage PSS2]
MRPLGFTLSKAQQLKTEENLNLARKEAWRAFKRQSPRSRLPYDDLEAAAFIGLMKACFRFDEEFGCKFSTYAVPKIRGEILHFIRDHTYLLKLTHRMRETWQRGKRLLDQGNSDIEIAKALEIELEVWLDTRSACSGPPLELKEYAGLHGDELVAKEDDRLGPLLRAVDRAWELVGDKGQRHLAQAFRFNHLLDHTYSQKLVQVAEAEFNVSR